MRNLFSYILLISLLSPTVVEAFHAISDSHEISSEENLNFSQLKVDCQINLMSNQDDDVNFISNYSYESIISQNYFINSFEYERFEIDSIYSAFLRRGPPNRA